MDQLEKTKNAVFSEIKKYKPGEIISIEGLREYNLALHDYTRLMSAKLVEDRIKGFTYFKVQELDLNQIETAWEETRELTEQQKTRLRSKVNLFKNQFRINQWCPPLIFDPFSRTLIDGNHRALALKELGINKVLAFVAAMSYSFETEKRS